MERCIFLHSKHPISEDDLTIYFVQQDREQLLKITALESEETGNKVKRIIDSFHQVSILNTRFETLLVKISLLNNDKMIIYNHEDFVQLHHTI